MKEIILYLKYVIHPEIYTLLQNLILKMSTSFYNLNLLSLESYLFILPIILHTG
jgi:hypothetical protein